MGSHNLPHMSGVLVGKARTGVKDLTVRTAQTRSMMEIMTKSRAAKYQIGQVVKHRLFSFRGVVFDIDPTFSNTDEWYNSIPADVRPSKDQPFYHLFAENADSEYIAYVSEQNLLPDTSGEPVRHPQISEVLKRDRQGNYRLRNSLMH